MELQLTLVQTSALALLLLVFGEYARRRVYFLEKFCIPAPVVGGFLFSILVLILRQTGTVELSLDTTLQSPAMIAFFTTIGLAGSLATIKKGGKLLLMYLVVCWSLAIFQNLIGIGMAKVLGVNPILGIMAGAVSLEGGHGGAAAFGPTAEAMGVEGATTVAIASATFGLVAGSLIGGTLASYLMTRHKIEAPKPDKARGFLATVGAGPKRSSGSAGAVADYDGVPDAHDASSDEAKSNYSTLLSTATIIGVIMVIGMLLGDWLADLTGFALPAYVGAMIIAVIFRNVNDKLGWIKVDDDAVNLISQLTLGFFLTLAMMSLKIWELASLAGPLAIILLVQLGFIIFFAGFVVFRLLGKNYDAATMVAGFLGHGLGATPNAMANMDAFNSKFGVRSERAFLIVPLAGAVLIDMVALPWIVWCMNFVG
ncbi:sodium/glutamate symporter [Glutamicibacter sp.]|uniref:sodium/glutamate symporter n=1 Tax=Glutamicibacter sp. TaxID=1931995 RepID=UPI0028BF22BA|nr:sodium/glutamate symporter [Glutamicibacter sp.]